MSLRRHVYYSGSVQGVGFRYAVRSLARGRDIGGFVRNLPDGRVELLAEGPEEEVLGLLADVAAEMGSYIREAQVLDEAPEGTFRGFGVAL
ncbi:MAG: acylphosphatase [Planctomycetes bacterium]|nr:acylphosphatase [Planctomycetota bacterium]